VLFVDHAILKAWNPPLRNAGERRATWTSASVQGLQLTNSLEEAAWNVDPAQVHICQQCGTYGCYDGGYARITRLGEHVLWTAPYLNDTMERLDIDSVAGAIFERAAVAIPIRVWESWRNRAPGLPAPQSFPAATRRELAAAWRMEAPPGLREQSWMEMLTHLSQRLLATDSLGYDQAMDQIHALLDWFLEAPTEPLPGDLIPLKATRARLEVLRFDGPADRDWSALAYDQGAWLPALGSEWIYSEA
jgi:hypothetical protein